MKHLKEQRSQQLILLSQNTRVAKSRAIICGAIWQILWRNDYRLEILLCGDEVPGAVAEAKTCQL